MPPGTTGATQACLPWRDAPVSSQSLRQRRAAVLLDDGGIGRVDATVGVHVGAEIGTRDGQADLRFNLAYIGGVNDAVPVRVAQEHTHRHGHIVCRGAIDRKSTRLNSSHGYISYAV